MLELCIPNLLQYSVVSSFFHPAPTPYLLVTWDLPPSTLCAQLFTRNSWGHSNQINREIYAQRSEISRGCYSLNKRLLALLNILFKKKQNFPKNSILGFSVGQQIASVVQLCCELCWGVKRAVRLSARRVRVTQGCRGGRWDRGEWTLPSTK